MSHSIPCYCPICLPIEPVATKTTDSLWTETHSALCAGRWSEARALLDDLGRRTDIRDILLTVDQYAAMCGKNLRPEYRPVLADRIDLVNSRV